MPQAVIDDIDQFKAYLASQPLCQWAAQKQREIDSGTVAPRGRPPIHAPPPKNDNAELAAALAAMA